LSTTTGSGSAARMEAAAEFVVALVTPWVPPPAAVAAPCEEFEAVCASLSVGAADRAWGSCSPVPGGRRMGYQLLSRAAARGSDSVRAVEAVAGMGTVFCKRRVCH
jgi:hypothetical protein